VPSGRVPVGSHGISKRHEWTPLAGLCALPLSSLPGRAGGLVLEALYIVARVTSGRCRWRAGAELEAGWCR
jgi:hypothetical protein